MNRTWRSWPNHSQGSCEWFDCDFEVLWVELKQILHLKVGCSDFGPVWDRDSLPYSKFCPGRFDNRQETKQRRSASWQMEYNYWRTAISYYRINTGCPIKKATQAFGSCSRTRVPILFKLSMDIVWKMAKINSHKSKQLGRVTTSGMRFA